MDDIRDRQGQPIDQLPRAGVRRTASRDGTRLVRAGGAPVDRPGSAGGAGSRRPPGAPAERTGRNRRRDLPVWERAGGDAQGSSLVSDCRFARAAGSTRTRRCQPLAAVRFRVSAGLPVVTDFEQLAAPHRGELLAHCYRMLGAADDAEDAVQETYLRAWRAYDRFDGRSSLRTWLYRIATNVCLTALEQRGRRPLPSGLGAPSDDPDRPPVEAAGVRWLGPLPDAVLDPASVVAGRAGLRLALIAALQHLPGRQRAVLILRDVLGWPAAEVAELLETSPVAVKSALQRARERLGALALVEDDVGEPGHPDLLDRYVQAFVRADVTALTELLRIDATLEMPPYGTWFRGREHVLAFLAARVLGAAQRAVPTAANGQPAMATYGPDGNPHSVQVLTVRGGRVAGIVAFLDPALFPRFGLTGSS